MSRVTESAEAAPPPMPGRPITGPSAWRAEDLRRSEEWIVRLSPADLRELEAAVAGVRDRDLATVRYPDFPLPTLGTVIDEVRHELLHGRGFVLIRGLPMDRWTYRDAATAYWGLGAHLGGLVVGLVFSLGAARKGQQGER